MADIHLTRRNGESTAAFACRYMLFRIGSDPNLAHYMAHTEAFGLLIQGVADEHGDTPDYLRGQVLGMWAKQTREADVIRMRHDLSRFRKQVKDLSDRLITAQVREKESDDLMSEEDSKDLAASRKAVWKIEERVRMAELGVEELDVENLRDILDARFAKAGQ